MTTARLFLSGIAASGHPGARAGEKDEAQDFVVDLDVEGEGEVEQIVATADDRGVSGAVRSVFADGSDDQIGVMASDIAERVLATVHVTRVTAVVHKPNAASRLGIDGVAAAVTLAAGEP
jgi:dihydroneopterin aldolase